MTLEPIAVRAAAPATVEIPPVHLDLTWRPLRAVDSPTLFALLQAIQTADQAPARYSAAEVDEMFEGDWKDLERDTLGGFDQAGTLRAFGLVEVRPGDRTTVRAFLHGGVHPLWRGRGIGRAVLRWMEGRGRQKLAESGKDLPARLAVYVDEAARDNRRLYAAGGFSPIRWYTQMRRDLRAPLPAATVPEGLRLAPWSADLDEPARLAHNEAFADHWGSEPQTPETWRQRGASFMPSWSFVVLDTTGAADEVAGYVLSGRYPQDWPVLGYTFGFVDLIGVRPAWRGRGLAVALLAQAMTAFRADGLQYAALGVDTANPTGAYGLYERLGFEPTHGEVLYSVEL